MKVCKKCGRVQRNKRWVVLDQYKIERARTMGELEETHCPACLRHVENFVATLQVRGRFNIDEVEKIMQDVLDKSFKKGERENIYIKNGDYRFTKKSMATKVARLLAERGAEVQLTSKIFSMDTLTSKDLTRLTIVARFKILVGDVVKIKNELKVVEKSSGGWVWLKDGKKTRAKDLKVVEVERLKGNVISVHPPMIFIPKTNETLEIEHDKPQGAEIILLRKDDFKAVI